MELETTKPTDESLADWRGRALALEDELGKSIVGQSRAIRPLCAAVFGRGRVLLEGRVGVGKTTLLRAPARAVGGECEKIDGTVDLERRTYAVQRYVNWIAA